MEGKSIDEPPKKQPKPKDCDCFHVVLMNIIKTTFDNGSLGSRNDEERSELR